jgi:hypothetical protein
MKIDLKTAITIATLLFASAGFYYTTVSDINVLSLHIKALESENSLQQKRLDAHDKKITRMNKQIRDLKVKN